MPEEEHSFLKPAAGPEIDKEKSPEIKNERVEIGNYVLEPVDREANKFHFLQNLTEWHHVCIRTDNVIWERELGGFSEEEKKAIDDFRVIMGKYPQYNEKGLYSIYTASISPKERSERLQKNVSAKDRKTIEKCLSTIENSFSRIWQKRESKLLRARQEFIENLKNFETSGKGERLAKDLTTFFGFSGKTDKLKTFFLMREVPGTGGSACLRPDAMALNGLGKLKLSVFYHELIHNTWELNPRYQQLLEEAVGSVDKGMADYLKGTGLHGGDIHEIIHEYAIGSLLPNGYLGEKYFSEELPAHGSLGGIRNTLEDLLVNKKEVQFPDREKVALKELSKDKEKMEWAYLNVFINTNLAPLSQRYIEEGRPADKAYFQEAIKTILSSIERTKIF